MKWNYTILATGKTHFSDVKTNRINKIAFGTTLKVENKCRLTIVCVLIALHFGLIYDTTIPRVASLNPQDV